MNGQTGWDMVRTMLLAICMWGSFLMFFVIGLFQDYEVATYWGVSGLVFRRFAVWSGAEKLR